MKTIRELEYDGLMDQIEHLSTYTAWLQETATMTNFDTACVHADWETHERLSTAYRFWAGYRESLKTALIALAGQTQAISERPALRTREVPIAGHVLTEWLFSEPRSVKILNACWSEVVIDPVGRQRINALRYQTSAPVVLIWD